MNTELAPTPSDRSADRFFDNYPCPSLRRRLICMVYESFLLFGIIFVGSMVFDVATQSRHALYLRHARMSWLFFLIGLYFCYCWLGSGQTLAMKTWRIKLVAAAGQTRLTAKAAVFRYVLAWMWFMPALAADAIFGLKTWASVSLIVVGFITWASLIWLDPQRQFMHDRIAGTRLISLLPKPEEKPSAEAASTPDSSKPTNQA